MGPDSVAPDMRDGSIRAYANSLVCRANAVDWELVALSTTYRCHRALYPDFCSFFSLSISANWLLLMIESDIVSLIRIMSTATSGSIKVTVPALTGTGDYQFWSLRLRGILGTTTSTGTTVTAWDLTGIPESELTPLPEVRAVRAAVQGRDAVPAVAATDSTPAQPGRPAVAAQAAVTQTMHDEDLAKRRADVAARDSLKKTAISIIIAGLGDSMLHLAKGDDPRVIWKQIKDMYGTAGPAEVYHSFMRALNWRIPADKEPSLSIAELAAVFANLESQGVDIPEVIEAMILLRSAPGNTDSLAQSLLANHQELDDLTWDRVRGAIMSLWAQRADPSANRARMSNGRWQPSAPGPSNKRFQSGPRNNNGGNKPAFGNQQRMHPQSHNDQSRRPQQEDCQKRRGTRGGRGRGKGRANVATDEYTADAAMEFASVAQRPEVSPPSLLHRITPGGELPVKPADRPSQVGPISIRKQRSAERQRTRRVAPLDPTPMKFGEPFDGIFPDRIPIRPMRLSAAKKRAIAAWDDRMGNALVNSEFAPIGCITKDESIDVEQSFVEPANVENLRKRFARWPDSELIVNRLHEIGVTEEHLPRKREDGEFNPLRFHFGSGWIGPIIELTDERRHSISAWNQRLGLSTPIPDDAPIGAITQQEAADVEMAYEHIDDYNLRELNRRFKNPVQEKLINYLLAQDGIDRSNKDLFGDTESDLDAENEDWPTSASPFKEYVANQLYDWIDTKDNSQLRARTNVGGRAGGESAKGAGLYKNSFALVYESVFVSRTSNLCERPDGAPSIQTPVRCKIIQSLNLVKDNNPEWVNWLLDSGASAHFTPFRSDFSTIDEGLRGIIQTAKRGAPLYIKGEGSIMVESEVPVGTKGTRKVQVLLSPVFYVPGMNERLLSMGKLLQTGLRAESDQNGTVFYNESGAGVLCSRPRSSLQPTLQSIRTRILHMDPEAKPALQGPDYVIWHNRFGHPSDRVLTKMVDNCIGGSRVSIPNRRNICDGCARGKMHNMPFPPNLKRATKIHEHVHSDLFELPVLSYRRYKWCFSDLKMKPPKG
ncbi:hypothetical protein NP233_g11012 [Leucocoprinus birnbaumii]|uniref:GAG-pre-integrase domain-containing protein n=1 Tax=Leucocoprinus birnbaumii TaxID=56174 RepID=A0AAD5VH77_9AGAR|nr:hypothetical protein NP233_g11012 [Leucocoprinus birnbaumii]